MTFVHVLRTEFLKLRHSKVTWLSLVAFGLAPMGIALMMWIVREPERAAQLGLVGAKAELAGITATWPSYSAMITQVVGSAGLVLLAFIVAYVFGREYSDGTAKNLLALPVGRHYFVLAKFVVAGAWWAVLTVFSLVEAFAVGFALQLPGFSGGLAATTVGNTLSAAAISYLLAPVVAWIATLGRGYLAPLAFAIGTLVLGTLFSKTGWADWFPWTIVPSLVGSLGGSGEAPGMGSLTVVAAVFILGIGATVAQLRYADNTQ